MNTSIRIIIALQMLVPSLINATGRIASTAYYTLSVPERPNPVHVYVLGGGA